MDTTPTIGQDLLQVGALEQRRVHCLNSGDGRLAKAEKRIAATEARIAECRRVYDDECVKDAAKLSHEVNKVHARAEKTIVDLQASEQAVRERREAVEHQTQQMLAEAQTIREGTDDARSSLRQEVAAMDQNIEQMLRSTNADVSSLRDGTEDKVHGIFGNLSAESTRVWSLEDHECFAKDLTGAQTLLAPDPLPPREVLPFGSHHMPFDGYGKYGLKPPQKPPKGFKEETARRIHMVAGAA